MQVDAEPPQSFDSIRRVRNPRLLIVLAGVVRQDWQDCSLDLFPAQRPLADGKKVSLHTNRGRGPGHQQQIASLARDQLLQPLIKLNRLAGWGFGMNKLNAGRISFDCHNLNFKGIRAGLPSDSAHGSAWQELLDRRTGPS